MRTKILKLAGVLLLIFIIFSLLDRNSVHSLERNVWMLERDFSKLATQQDSLIAAQHQEVFTKDIFDHYIKRCRAFIDKHPKTIYASKAQLLLGKVYLVQKQYKQSRIEFHKVGEIIQNDNVVSEAVSLIAKSYEHEGDWPNALLAYQTLSKEFPLTRNGFFTPIYIAKYYESKKEWALSKEAYDQAIIFYQKLAADQPKSPTAYYAMRLILKIQIGQRKWAEALSTINQTIAMFPSDPNIERYKKLAELIQKRFNVGTP